MEKRILVREEYRTICINILDRLRFRLLEDGNWEPLLLTDIQYEDQLKKSSLYDVIKIMKENYFIDVVIEYDRNIKTGRFEGQSILISEEGDYWYCQQIKNKKTLDHYITDVYNWLNYNA